MLLFYRNNIPSSIPGSNNLLPVNLLSSNHVVFIIFTHILFIVLILFHLKICIWEMCIRHSK